MNGSIPVKGYPEVGLANLFSTGENAPAPFLLALSLGDHFSRIFDNPLERAKISGVALEFSLEKDRRTAVLESVRTDVTEVRPGDEINVEAVFRPYRADPIFPRIRVPV